MPARATSPRPSPGLRWLAAFAVAVATHAAYGQKLQVRQSTAVRELPSQSAPAVKTLPAQTVVEGTGVRSGAWIQILMPGGEPPSKQWVYLFDVQALPEPTATSTAAPNNAAAAGFGSVLRGIGQLLQPNTSTRTVATSTAGIRGLGQEDLRRATPNVLALQTLQEQRASEGGAQQFAHEQGWLARQVPPLPPPPSAPPKESHSP